MFEKGDKRNTIGSFSSHPGSTNGRYKHGKWGTEGYGRAHQLWRRYKMTPEQYVVKIAEQGGHCALCLAVGTQTKSMPVDHNHNCCNGTESCGKCIRGILCQRCNVKLGYFEGFINEATSVVPKWDTWLENAILYLRKYSG